MSRIPAQSRVKATLRKTHRWLGLLMVLQLIAWMGSGLYFRLFPIEEIRGEHLTRPPEAMDASSLGSRPSFSAVRQALDQHFESSWEAESVELVPREGRLVWKIRGEVSGKKFSRLVEPEGARVIPMLSKQAATQRAERWLIEYVPASRAQWIEAGAGDSEFRGRDSAAWKVDFEGSEPVSLYIDPWTGDIMARRTARWRLFDFLWMLHIMDYDSRDNFNHPLLQGAAILGLLIALSGLAYWAMTNRLTRRKHRRVPPKIS